MTPRLGPRNGVGTGGMATKVEAALIAAQAGVPVVVTSTAQVGGGAGGGAGRHPVPAHGPAARRPAVLAALRQPPARPADPRRRRRARRPRAARLAAGGRHHRRDGEFLADDPVELVGPDGVVVARGLVAYDARELPALLGRKTGDLAARSTAARSCTATRWCWSRRRTGA